MSEDITIYNSKELFRMLCRVAEVLEKLASDMKQMVPAKELNIGAIDGCLQYTIYQDGVQVSFDLGSFWREGDDA